MTRTRWAAEAVETAGLACLVIGAALLAVWAAWLVAGAGLVVKAWALERSSQ